MSKFMDWTPQHDDKLREWFAAGLSAGEIASKMGVSRGTVSGRKFRLGICSAENSRPYSDDDIATLVAMRKRGIKFERIAKALKRSSESLAVKASKLGITRPYERRA